MNLQTRVRRRQRNRRSPADDWAVVSPVAHVADPVGREPVVERLLDHLDPLFEGGLPGNAYLWGPPGAGKSAVVTALATQFRTRTPGSVIHTAARDRTGGEGGPAFVYVDARDADTEFGLYHAVLDALADEPAPTRGVGADSLRERIASELTPHGRRAVVAVDHVGEPETYGLDDVGAALDDLDSLAWLAVGRTDPAAAVSPPAACIEVPAYQQETLREVVSSRATTGLSGPSVEHDQSVAIARWAEGNAHDALAVLYGATDRAVAAGRSRVAGGDLADAFRDVPRPSVSLARTLLLAPNRQRVLRALLDIDDGERSSVGRAAEAVAATERVDLSSGTVKRFLYELADDGFLERVRSTAGSDAPGRPPSTVEPRFPTRVFRRLFDETPVR